MKKGILIILIIFLAAGFLCFSYGDSEVSEEWKQDKELQARIEKYLEDKKGNYSFYIIDPKTKEYASINESKYIAASIIKTYLLVQVHKEIRDGNLSFDDKLTLMDKYKVAGSGVIAKEAEGRKYTIRELLELVITISDNVAANMLADHIGLEKIRATMAEFGLENSNYGHLILSKEKMKYFYGWNRTSTKDLASIYYRIYTNTCLGEEYDKMLIELFTKCRSNYKIPQLLPKGTKVSHKTGSLPLYEHDAGIVFTENRDYIIACMSNDLKSNREGQRTIANVSKIVYNHMMEKDKKERSGELKLSDSKLILKDKEIDIYDFKDSLVLSITDLLKGNLVFDNTSDTNTNGTMHLYGGNPENICAEEKVFEIPYPPDAPAFDGNEGIMERNKILMDKKLSNIINSENETFVFLEDLKEIGKITALENGNYTMKSYAGNIEIPKDPVFILGEQVIAYDVEGEIYLPLGYYYSCKSKNSRELIEKYTDYLVAKGINYEISKAEYVELDYKNDIEKFDILSIGGSFVINMDEIEGILPFSDQVNFRERINLR